MTPASLVSGQWSNCQGSAWPGVNLRFFPWLPVLWVRDVYPGSRILILIHPGSRIQQQQPNGAGNNLLPHLFLGTNIWTGIGKNVRQFTKNYSIFTQKMQLSFQKYGFGILALEKTSSGSDPIDPGSRAKKAPYPGSANTDGSYCLNMSSSLCPYYVYL